MVATFSKYDATVATFSKYDATLRRFVSVELESVACKGSNGAGCAGWRCLACPGHGKVPAPAALDALGRIKSHACDGLETRAACPRCKGTGESGFKYSPACLRCAGSGHVILCACGRETSK